MKQLQAQTKNGVADKINVYAIDSLYSKMPPFWVFFFQFSGHRRTFYSMGTFLLAAFAIFGAALRLFHFFCSLRLLRFFSRLRGFCDFFSRLRGFYGFLLRLCGFDSPYNRPPFKSRYELSQRALR